MKHQMRWLPAV